MDLMTWIKARRNAEDDIAKLTTQFLLTLRAYFARVEPPQPPASTALYDRVGVLLDPARNPTWNDCYEAEQLLVDLFDEETLRAELDTRKLEASNLRPALAEHYLQAIEKADEPERQRVLLARLINDLQWRYTIGQGKRQFAKSLTWRTGVVAAVVLVLYAVLIGVLRWSPWLLQHSDLSLFFVAALSGAWGATFSMMTSMQGRIDASEIYDLNVMRAYVMIISRVLIGVAAAAILYFFLTSGLLGGTAFPALSPVAGAEDATAPCLQNPTSCLPIKDLALLIVWCILAGFSEQLVPSLLAKTEARADSNPPERFRPNDLGPPQGPVAEDKPIAPEAPAQAPDANGAPTKPSE